MLSKALDKYNDTVHSSTKMKPKDAHDDKNIQEPYGRQGEFDKEGKEHLQISRGQSESRSLRRKKTTTPRGRSITQSGAINPTKSSR